MIVFSKERVVPMGGYVYCVYVPMIPSKASCALLGARWELPWKFLGTSCSLLLFWIVHKVGNEQGGRVPLPGAPETSWELLGSLLGI